MSWSWLLESEALEWPDVTVRPMFGRKALYRGWLISAVLPNQRKLWSANSIDHKLHSEDSAAGGWPAPHHILRRRPTGRA